LDDRNMSIRMIGTAVAMLALLGPGAVLAEQKPAAANVKLPPGITLQQTAAGPALADEKGLTAYVFDKDKTAGASACNGNCAKAWPPLIAEANAKPVAGWSPVSREDGTSQWAYKGKPLYRFDKWDTKPGDITGNNVGGIWHIAAP
jgi:predicted lipoprotein with Yx(FWY)xxD motif